MKRSAIFRWSMLLLSLALASVVFAPTPIDVTASDPFQATPMDCTFTVTVPVATLRTGAGTTFETAGSLSNGDTLHVVGQATGDDGFVWWQGEDGNWVRSDLGTSDCPATCGNNVCEIGEDASICAQDCTGATSTTGGATTGGAAQVTGTLNCTFTVTFPVVLLRSGPGTTFSRVGFLNDGDTLNVVGQDAGPDGFVWWQSADDTWVRSDLGTSDCPATCGNTVCEIGEDATTCAQDCTGTTGTTTGAGTAAATDEQLTSTGTSCLVANSQQCFESIDCYPNCSVCTSSLNEFGCVSCECTFPGGATDTTTSLDVPAQSIPTGGECVFATCEECIAAFPCEGGVCPNATCELNEFGCPTCQTSG